MRFERRRDEGFGSNLYIAIGWLSVTYSRFEDHHYLAFMWARPLPRSSTK